MINNERNMKVRYGQRKQAYMLRQSLASKIYITESDFISLLGQYSYYGFDWRCNQILFYKKLQCQKYDWLFIEIVSLENKNIIKDGA